MAYVDKLLFAVLGERVTYQDINELAANDDYLYQLTDSKYIKIGSFTRDLSLAGGEVEYTGVGFRATNLIITGGLNGKSVSFGIEFKGDSTCISAIHGGIPIVNNLALISVNMDAVSDDIYAGFSGYTDDSFTLQWVNSGTGTASFKYIAFNQGYSV